MQLETKDFNSELYVGFEVHNLFVDDNGNAMKFDETDAVKSLLKIENINCELFSKTKVLVSRTFKNTLELKIDTNMVKVEIVDDCIHARETVLGFREPRKPKCDCKVNVIDGSKMHCDTSMRVVN